MLGDLPPLPGGGSTVCDPLEGKRVPRMKLCRHFMAMLVPLFAVLPAIEGQTMPPRAALPLIRNSSPHISRYLANISSPACAMPPHPRHVSSPEPVLFSRCAPAISAYFNLAFVWRPSAAGIPQCCEMTRGVCLPLAHIVGFPKCGTTALHAALLMNRAVYEGRTKELGLPWDILEDSRQHHRNSHKLDSFMKSLRRWHHTPSDVQSDAVLLNSDVFENKQLASMSRSVPNARLVFMLRDPIKRALSALRHLYRAQHPNRNQTSPNSAMPHHVLLRSISEAVSKASRSGFCLTNAVAPEDRLSTIITLALNGLGREPWPSCLYGRVSPCHYPNAATTGEGAMALQPTQHRSIPGIVLYLSPIIEAHALFGASRVDVRWLESFRTDPSTHIANVTRFLGLPDLPHDKMMLLHNEHALTAVMRSSNGSVRSALVGPWSSNPSNGKGGGDGGDDAAPAEAIEALRHFFEPYERARRAYFAWAGLPEKPA